jgi:hypothetical protein
VETRLDAARRRAGTAKRALTGVAAAGFVGVLLLARASHPGHATQPAASVSGSGSVIAPAEADGGSFFSPSPQASTHVS